MTNLLCARCRNVWAKSYLNNFPTLICPVCGLENSTPEAIKRANQVASTEQPGFICVSCLLPRQLGETVVKETREHSFPFRRRANWFKQFNPDLRKSEKVYRHDFGGFGTQIVREERVCQSCIASS